MPRETLVCDICGGEPNENGDLRGWWSLQSPPAMLWGRVHSQSLRRGEPTRYDFCPECGKELGDTLIAIMRAKEGK